MKRLLILIPLLLIATLVVLFVILRKPSSTPTQTITSEQPPAPPNAELVARAASSTRQTSVTRNGGQAEPLTPGRQLQNDDTITTGANGTASLEFYSGIRIGLDARTTVIVHRAEKNPTNQRETHISVELLNGRLWSRVLPPLDTRSTYEMRYNNVVITATGTAFMVTGQAKTAGTRVNIDTFQGNATIQGPLQGTIREGLSSTFRTGAPPQNFNQSLSFTADDVRNAPWAQTQLREDRNFTEAVSPIRRTFNTNEKLGDIGNETGLFTTPSGSAPSDASAILVTAASGQKTGAGKIVQLKAVAVSKTGSGSTSQADITPLVRWFISDPTRGSVTQDGRLTIENNATGTLAILARWTNGQRERSGGAVIAITPPTIRPSPTSTPETP